MTAIDGIQKPKKSTSISLPNPNGQKITKKAQDVSYALLESSIDQLIGWVKRSHSIRAAIPDVDMVIREPKSMGVTAIPVSRAVESFSHSFLGSLKFSELASTLRFWIISLTTWVLFAVNTVAYRVYIAAHELYSLAGNLPRKARQLLASIDELSYILQVKELRELAWIEWRLSFKLFSRKLENWLEKVSGLARKYYLALLVVVSTVTLGIATIAGGSSSFLQTLSARHAVSAEMEVFGVGGSNLISRDILKLRKEAPRSFIIEHVVEPGQTTAVLSTLYGVKEDTITFNNGIAAGEVEAGTKLYIPPLDSYINIASNDTKTEELARIYKVKTDELFAYNPSLAGQEQIGKGMVTLVPVSDFELVKQYQKDETDRLKEVAAQEAAASFRARALASAAYKKLDFLDSGKVADLNFGLPVQEKYNRATTYFNHWNNAVDFGTGDENPSALASNSGTVVEVKSGCPDVSVPCYNSGNNDNPYYGNYITIDHGNGYRTRYAHLRAPLVNIGDTVQKGQEIGIISWSGFSFGKHLHFEVLKKDGDNWFGVFPPYVIPAIRM